MSASEIPHLWRVDGPITLDEVDAVIEAIMTTSDATSPIQVLLIMFDRMDTLDFTSPLETLSIACSPLNDARTKSFDITAVAAKDMTTTDEGIAIQRHVSIAEATKRLSQFDILIVPGGKMDVMMSLAADGNPEFDLLKAFAALPAREEDIERTIVSICTGALILAAAGILNGKQATTSHLALDLLRDACVPAGTTTVVQSRFVDAGLSENGTRIITSGGLSSGFDAVLHLVELRSGIETARGVEKILEHAWRRDEGTVVA
ncbi:MAG: hypothetical protein M1818_003720 [Claussenomyces sp. TS43310]|nr:MAG: hypothetical protein M1818_003720 [Claussenomyces sp. TS43310]